MTNPVCAALTVVLLAALPGCTTAPAEPQVVTETVTETVTEVDVVCLDAIDAAETYMDQMSDVLGIIQEATLAAAVDDVAAMAEANGRLSAQVEGLEVTSMVFRASADTCRNYATEADR